MARQKLNVDREALETIGARAPKRDRSYEQAQRARGVVVTYRGIPRALHDRLKEIAGGLGVPVGDVVRALLEHGLADYDAGALSLEPQEVVTKGRLYPGKT